MRHRVAGTRHDARIPPEVALSAHHPLRADGRACLRDGQGVGDDMKDRTTITSVEAGVPHWTAGDRLPEHREAAARRPHRAATARITRCGRGHLLEMAAQAGNRQRARFPLGGLSGDECQGILSVAQAVAGDGRIDGGGRSIPV
jgi:hypothetical protein